MTAPHDDQAFIKTGVIGDPVSHSLSPLIHNYWLDLYGVCGRYDRLQTPASGFDKIFQDYLGQGYTGFNITLPHKERALDVCDEVSAAARAIGAVNTIALKDSGRIYGMNTDVYGYTANLKEQAPLLRFKDTTALVIGAGGAARAVIYGLKDAGCREIRITNRTTARAEDLAESFSATAYAWEQRQAAARGCGLVVNTTPLGMKGQPPLSFDVAALDDGTVVSDIVYTPFYTPFLQAARKRGLPVVTGLGMLCHQAVPGFEIWYGVRPTITENLRAMLYKNLGIHPAQKAGGTA